MTTTTTYYEAKAAIENALDQAAEHTRQSWAGMSEEVVNHWIDRCREIGAEATVAEMDEYYA